MARAVSGGDRVGAASVLFILFVIAVALLAPVIAPYDPVHTTSSVGTC